MELWLEDRSLICFNRKIERYKEKPGKVLVGRNCVTDERTSTILPANHRRISLFVCLFLFVFKSRRRLVVLL